MCRDALSEFYKCMAGGERVQRLRGRVRAVVITAGIADTSLIELVEWSYPRNWGSFVWNEEGRSEYTLSPYLFPWLAA